MLKLLISTTVLVVFIVLSCWRYPSQHRYDVCAQIDIFVVAVEKSLLNFALSSGDVLMLLVLLYSL